MKRAEVFKQYATVSRPWQVAVNDRGPVMDVLGEQTGHPTYEAALAHALAEVGLATPEQHREAP